MHWRQATSFVSELSLNLFLVNCWNMLNILVPIFIIGISSVLLIKLVLLNRIYIVTPLIWFLIASICYFGFGPLIYEFGNQPSIDYLQRFNKINESELLKTNILNLVGLLITLFAYKISPSVNFIFLNSNYIKFNTKSLLILFTILVAVSYVIIFLNDCIKLNYGQLFNKIYDIRYGILLISAYLIRPKISLQNISLFFLILILLVFDILSFSKLKIIQSIIFIFLGYFLNNIKLKNIIIALISLLILFPILDRAISELRHNRLIDVPKCTTYFRNLSAPDASALSPTEESGAQKTYTNVIKNSLSIFTDSELKINYAWIRFVLAPNQSYVMNLYDTDKKANNLNSFLWIAVPRFLLPSKPVIHPLSNYEDERIDLILNSGFFAEGYWNLGWIGVIIVSILSGIFLKFGTNLSLTIVKNNIYLLYPLVTSIIMTSHRVEDWFTLNVYSSFIYSGYICIALIIFIKLKIRN